MCHPFGHLVILLQFQFLEKYTVTLKKTVKSVFVDVSSCSFRQIQSPNKIQGKSSSCLKVSLPKHPNKHPFHLVIWCYMTVKTKCILYSCYPKYLKALNNKKTSSFPETRRKSSVQSHEGRGRPNESVQRLQGFDPYQLCQRNWMDNWPQRTRLGKQLKTTQRHNDMSDFVVPFFWMFFFVATNRWLLFRFIFAESCKESTCLCTVDRRKKLLREGKTK